MDLEKIKQIAKRVQKQESKSFQFPRHKWMKTDVELVQEIDEWLKKQGI